MLAAPKLIVNKDADVLLLPREEALEFLMSKYEKEVRRLIYYYVKDNSLAEDLTQDVFIKIYLKLDTFTGRGTLKSWIYSIAINSCKDYLKGWSQTRICYLGSFLGLNACSDENIEDDVIHDYECKLLWRTILQLPFIYREVIILFYYKSYSVEEISSLLTVHEGTIRIRLHRARKLLKKKVI
jgi:RNA polymerase sigma-70 factor (ECF subfamily)